MRGVANAHRKRPESPVPCNVASSYYFTHLFDHLSMQYGGLPITEEEVGSVRQEPFLVLTSGIPSPNTRIPHLKKAHTAHRWIYTRASRLLNLSPAYASLVLDDRYMVYPTDWHEDIRAAFGLEDPPTPTEVFSLFHTLYVPYLQSMKKYVSIHELCLLDYYCLGGQVPALAACYQTTPEQIIWLLSQTIKRLMTHLAFSLWASGSDLSPMISTFATRIYMTNLMGKGKAARLQGGITDSAHAPKALRDLRKIKNENPYYRLIVYEGLRLNPIPRAFTKTRLAWDTPEAKRTEESTYWYILFKMREVARNNWMVQRLFGKKALLETTKIVYPVYTKPHHLHFNPREPYTTPEYMELAELYGQGTLDEDRVTAIRSKWAHAFYARTGRYPGYRSGRRLAGLPTNGLTDG